MPANKYRQTFAAAALPVSQGETVPGDYQEITPICCNSTSQEARHGTISPSRIAQHPMRSAVCRLPESFE